MFTFRIYFDRGLLDLLPHWGKPYDSTYSAWWLWFYVELDFYKHKNPTDSPF